MGSGLKFKLTRGQFMIVLVLLIGILLFFIGTIFVRARINAGSSSHMPYLTEGTREAVFARKDAITQQEGGWLMIVFNCDVLEGEHCYYVGAGSQIYLPKDLATKIVDQLNPRRVEHSHSQEGYVNTMTVWCLKTINGTRSIDCQIKQSDGWMSLPRQ